MSLFFAFFPEQKMNEFQAGYEQNKAAADNLRGKLDEMRRQLTHAGCQLQLCFVHNQLGTRSFFVRQISFLPAHDEHNAAKAQTEINKAMNGFSSDTATAGLKRMEEKMLQFQQSSKFVVHSTFLIQLFELFIQRFFLGSHFVARFNF
jgi:hypothetical protein